MCNLCNPGKNSLFHSGSPDNASRRRVLGAALAGMAATLPLGAMASKPPTPANVMRPKPALERLMQGNARYVAGTSEVAGFEQSRQRLAAGQNPFACILSCADSRIGPEYCFDEGRGDLFVTRVAGNFVTPEILASLEYGVAVLGAPLILVLGHTSCGAIGAAVDAYEKHTQFPGHIQSLTTALAGAVKAAQQSGASGNLVAAATEQNVIQNVRQLRQASPLLAPRVKSDDLLIVGGIYELSTGKVRLIDA